MDREVTPHPSQTERGWKECACFCTTALLLAVFPGTMLAQSAAPASSPTNTNAALANAPAKDNKTPRTGDRRKAVKLYLASSKLFVAERFEEAMRGYQKAAALDPSNADYPLAADVARSHAVTALVQASAKDRLRGDAAAARTALAHALELDPKSIQATEHLRELGDDTLLGHFHLRTAQRQAIQQVFKAYGIEATVDDSVRPTQIRLDVDDASFEQATHTVSLLTGSFFVPLDAHRVVVARDTPENRQQFVPQELETIYLPGLTATELTDVGNLAKNVFNAQQSVAEPTAGTLTIRAPEKTLDAFNATMRQLLDGHSQVMLDVRMIQLAHTNERNTGTQPPQQMTAFNVYSQEQSILSANSALVQQIISSGLAAPGDTLTILGILLASGQASSSLFSNGIALFGGGITTSGLSPGPTTVNLSLNSSDSRELDQIQLRLGDGEAGTLRTGMRYPITTSSFSNLSANTVNIPGLNTAGASSQLSSLLSSLSGSALQVPQVEYQDLGLTLKATPKVLRNGDVALTFDMKVDALAGQSLNGVPVLNSRAYSGVVTLKQDEGVVVLSEVDKQESRAISGVPGLSEIPGLNNLTGKDTQKNYATLLIVITPHVIRSTQAAGHSAQMRVDRSTPAR